MKRVLHASLPTGGAADPKGFAHCRRPLFWRDWWLVDWYTLKTILLTGSCILASLWHHFETILVSSWNLGIFLGPVGIILGPLGTTVGHLGNKLLYGGGIYRI